MLKEKSSNSFWKFLLNYKNYQRFEVYVSYFALSLF